MTSLHKAAEAIRYRRKPGTADTGSLILVGQLEIEGLPRTELQLQKWDGWELEFTIEAFAGQASRRFTAGRAKLLRDAKYVIYTTALRTLRTEQLGRALRLGVPDRWARLRYALWVGVWERGNVKVYTHGRFEETRHGSVRFETDDRTYWALRDELGRWSFCPLNADRLPIEGWDQEVADAAA